jgi:hypothetical protein
MAQITGNHRLQRDEFETGRQPDVCGAGVQKWDLGNNVTLNVWADDISCAKQSISLHRALVDESPARDQHDRYEFLLA